MTILFAAVLGLLVGSFLNVCIYRLPREESVVLPRSRCPACSHVLGALELIPVVSYALQRGKCKTCSARISPRYAVVELLTAGLFAWIAHSYIQQGDMRNGAAFLYFFSALLVVVFIDLDHFLILDTITYPGMVICLLGALWGHAPLSATTPVLRLIESAAGLVLGGGILWIIQFAGALWYRKQGLEAMGLGDVKFAAFTGAFLGPKFEAAALLLAVFIGGGVAIALMATGIKGRKDYIPFGPALAAGAALAPFFGEWVLSCYTIPS